MNRRSIPPGIHYAQTTRSRFVQNVEKEKLSENLFTNYTYGYIMNTEVKERRTSKINRVGGRKMEDMIKLKELINKLIEWLENKGFSDSDIKDCIKHITK